MNVLALEVGELRIKNLVTVEVSTSSATMREDNNNYRDLRSSDIAGHTFHSGRISSPKRELVILDGQRSRDQTDLSPALFHSTRYVDWLIDLNHVVNVEHVNGF